MYSIIVLYLYCVFKFAKFAKVLDEEDLFILQSNFYNYQTHWTYINAILQFGILFLISELLIFKIFNLNIITCGN